MRASTPTTLRLPPLPRWTTSVPRLGVEVLRGKASASPSRSPHRQRTAISARLRAPVGARREQRRIRAPPPRPTAGPRRTPTRSLAPLAPSSSLRVTAATAPERKVPTGGRLRSPQTGELIPPGSPEPSASRGDEPRSGRPDPHVAGRLDNPRSAELTGRSLAPARPRRPAAHAARLPRTTGKPSPSTRFVPASQRCPPGSRERPSRGITEPERLAALRKTDVPGDGCATY